MIDLSSRYITYPVDDEVKGLTLPSNREDIISRLRGAVTDQEVTIVWHFRFCALSATAKSATVVPSVRSQIAGIQEPKFPLQEFARRLLWWLLN